MKAAVVVTMFVAALGAQSAWAFDDLKKSQGAAASVVAMTEAEVRRVDKEAQKISLRHGPIANLDMPAMTMVFQVADPAMLDKMKAGDKVRFAAEKIKGEYTVTRIEVAK